MKAQFGLCFFSKNNKKSIYLLSFRRVKSMEFKYPHLVS